MTRFLSRYIILDKGTITTIYISKWSKFCQIKIYHLYLEADPLEVEDSQEVFMTDEGDTPPPELLVISNGTVV